MNRWKYAAKRLLLFIPQVLGIATLVFILSRLLPGNPAFLLAGPMAPEATVAAITSEMGLDQPIWRQYVIYLQGLLQGDLGRSWLTSQPVRTDILSRMPATLELIGTAMLVSLLVALPLAFYSAMKPGGRIRRYSDRYALVAGALPDFWWGLLAIYVFFGVLGWAPAPVGQLPLLTPAPTQRTGFLLIDSIISGELATFLAALRHLALPTLVLAFVYTGPVLKIAQRAITEAMNSEFIAYARALGLRRNTITRYALRNAAPPILTMAGMIFVFLISAAVLIESIFSWQGIGQYAVASVANSDYMALSGTVLASTTLALCVYLVMDLIHLSIDPRVRA